MKSSARLAIRFVLVQVIAGVGLVLAIYLNAAPQAEATLDESSSLPVCQRPGSLILPQSSPFFDQDRTLFLADWDVKAWRSTNDGATWEQIYSYDVPGTGRGLQDFVIAPLSPNPGLTLYLRYWHGPGEQVRLLRSTDSGDTWQERVSPCPPDTCLDGEGLKATNQPDTLFAALLPWSVFSPIGVDKSSDGGLSWQRVWWESPPWTLAISPDYAHDQTLFAQVIAPSPSNDVPLIASFDGGAHWEGSAAGLCGNVFVEQVEFSPGFATDRTLFARQAGAIFKSQDAGRTWRHLYPADLVPCDDVPYEVGADEIHLSPNYPSDHTLFMLTPYALHVSYDEGQTWYRLVDTPSPGVTFRFNVQRRPLAPESRREASASEEPTIRTRLTAPHSMYLPLLLVNPLPPEVHQLYLPLIAARGPLSLPLTLFMKARPHDGTTGFYRSDDGGLTWECLTLPPREYQASTSLPQGDLTTLKPLGIRWASNGTPTPGP